VTTISRYAFAAALASALPVMASLTPAHASAPTYTAEAAVPFTAASGCTTTTTNPTSTDATLPAAGKKHRVSVESTGTIVKTADSTDVSHVSASAQAVTSGTVTGHGFHVTLTASGKAKATAHDPSTTDCAAAVASEGEVTLPFKAPRGGWVARSLTDSGKGAQVVGDGLDTSSTSAPGFALLELLSGATYTHSSYVAPGKHTLLLVIGAEAATTKSTSDGPPAQTTASFKGSAAGDFYALGQAAGKESGTAKSVVELGDAVSCKQHKLSVTFTKSASKVEFTVGGEKAGTVKNAKAHMKASLKHVDPSGVATVVKATVSDGGKKTTVGRTYYGCSA
jgi:hypothetical protein